MFTNHNCFENLSLSSILSARLPHKLSVYFPLAGEFQGQLAWFAFVRQILHAPMTYFFRLFVTYLSRSFCYLLMVFTVWIVHGMDCIQCSIGAHCSLACQLSPILTAPVSALPLLLFATVRARPGPTVCHHCCHIIEPLVLTASPESSLCRHNALRSPPLLQCFFLPGPL